MPRLIWRTILNNIAEAREQLEKIEEQAKGSNKPSEVELQLMLEHAFHHLSFAWNIRHISAEKYSKLTDEEFNQWSKFPKELEEYYIEKKNDK